MARFLDELSSAFNEQRDAAIAEGQAAYLRNKFTFFGIKTPLRTSVQKKLFSKVALDESLDRIVRDLWKKEEREFQHAACDLLMRYKRDWQPELLELFAYMIRHKSWWDTVDMIATNCVGVLLQKYPELMHTMDEWIRDDDMWIRRSAILYQLKYKDKTDARRLFSYCKLQSSDTDFFIRKAIGWALRQYSKSNPEVVRAFLIKHHDSLSPLSIREASKYIGTGPEYS